MSDLSKQVKQLTARVQELEDTIYKMKKYYEDALSNLDDDNFSANYVSEKLGMKSQVSMTAEAIKMMVTNKEFTSRIEQTAGEIMSSVKNADGELSSRITQNADLISANVTAIEGNTTSIGNLSVKADEISTNVTDLKGRVKDAESNITQTTKDITASVKRIFTDVVVLDDDWNSAGKDKSKIYQVRGGNYYYHNGNEWVEVDSPTILSLFQQTSDGFKLIGDFSTTTQSGMNVDISGTRIDTYMGSGTFPKLSMGVSEDNKVYYPAIIMGEGTGTGGVAFGDFVAYPKQGVLIKDTNHFGIRYYYDTGKYIGISMNDGNVMTIKADTINFVGLGDDVGTATINGLTATFG